MEAIDSIKIVHVDGLTNTAGAGVGGAVGAVPGGENLASSAVAAALRYRAQAPIVDGLMKELGLNGSSLESLVAGAAEQGAAGVPPSAEIVAVPKAD